MLTKIPPFLISRSRVKDRDFIIYTKEPQLICEVFICRSLEEVEEKRKTYTTVTETNFKGITAVLVVLEVWGRVNDLGAFAKPLKRMADWYNGILQEKVNNQEL